MDLEDHVVLENVESDSAIEFVSHEEAYGSGFEDVERRVPDITRIRTATGWEPSRTLRECVADVVGYEEAVERCTLVPGTNS